MGATKAEIMEGQKNHSDGKAQQSFLNGNVRWTPATESKLNALTCDVEDYFQVSAFEDVIRRDDWLSRECRIPRNIDRILALYEEAGVQGTFFVLGWVARHHPTVVRRIADAGHEIASHGMVHSRVWNSTADEFFADLSLSRKLLEDVSGQQVKGFRAASWSMDQRTPWAHDQIAKAGYRYSSSIYPVTHDHYGVPDAPAYPFYIGDAGILEIPASTVSIAGRNWPAAGGGFFRLLPLTVSLALLRKSIEANGVPAVFYYHPWELDPNQPRVTGISIKTRFRHYVNLGRFENRLKKLLLQFRWGSMDEVFLANAR